MNKKEQIIKHTFLTPKEETELNIENWFRYSKEQRVFIDVIKAIDINEKGIVKTNIMILIDENRSFLTEHEETLRVLCGQKRTYHKVLEISPQSKPIIRGFY